MENLTPEQVIEKIQNTITEKTKGFVSKEDIDSIKSDLNAVKELAEKSALLGQENESFKTAIANLEGQIEGLKEAKKDDTPKAKSIGEAIFNAFRDAKDEIVNIAQKGGLMSLNVKAVDTMTITGNYSGGTVGLSSLESGVTSIRRRRPFMRQLVNSAGTSSKYVVWIEQANPEGVADMTAEGTLKNQVDFDLIERSCEVKKVTAFIKVSKEMIADIPFMQGEINGELIQLVELKLDQQLLSGTGAGLEITGVLQNAIPFTAPAQFVANVPSANNSDVLRIALAQIASANFDANYIVMNPEDVAGMELTKTTTGEYTYPMFVPQMDGITRLKGIPIVENNGIASGDYLVGDFSKSNLRIREDINVQVGYVNDDFTKNLMTVLCETRACNFVKTNDFGAFVKGNFATDIAVIDLP